MRFQNVQNIKSGEIGNIFVNGKILKKYSVQIHKIDPYFYEHYGKKYKLMKMDVNIYYLEFIFILLNISQPQKLMQNVILTETLFMERKDKKQQKKKLGCKLIRVKKAMMQTMKLIEYKHLPVNLKKDN